MPSLYIHVPFCRRKCPYCDFYSVPSSEALLRTYPDRLCRHLELAARGGWTGPMSTVYFGGGTPSLLSPEGVKMVLDAAAEVFGLDPAAEITLEANPGTVTERSLDGYRKAGVNRLSLGVQSFRADHLMRLGRIHDPSEALRAVRWAREAGFADLSCDLMFALPGQTVEDLEREMDDFLSLEPDHLSCYGLTVEEETPFHHLHHEGGLQLPEEEVYASHFLSLHHRLTGEGLVHYEISNYARPGRESRHNLRYWRRRGYLGIGAGAHSFRDGGWGERLAVPPDLEAYAAVLDRGEDPAETVETFDRRGAMSETLYLGLRTAEGVEEEGFRRRFGVGVQEAYPEAARQAGSHLRLKGGHWRFDPEGWLLFNHLITPFL